MKLVLSTENKRLSVKLEDDACGKLFDSLVREILHFEPVKEEIKRAAQAGDIHKEITPVTPKPDKPAEAAPGILRVGYTGFLYIRCPKCGKERGFCSRYPVTEFTCKNCGERLLLPEKLSQVSFQCKCGKTFRYKTNITDPSFDISCLDCDAPNAVFRNPKTGNYDDGERAK